MPDHETEWYEARGMSFDLPEMVLEPLRRGLKLHEEGVTGDGMKPETVGMATRGVNEGKWPAWKVWDAANWLNRHNHDFGPPADGKGPFDGREPGAGEAGWFLWGDDGTGQGPVDWKNITESCGRRWLNERKERMAELDAEARAQSFVKAQEADKAHRVAPWQARVSVGSLRPSARHLAQGYDRGPWLMCANRVVSHLNDIYLGTTDRWRTLMQSAEGERFVGRAKWLTKCYQRGWLVGAKADGGLTLVRAGDGEAIDQGDDWIEFYDPRRDVHIMRGEDGKNYGFLPVCGPLMSEGDICHQGYDQLRWGIHALAHLAAKGSLARVYSRVNSPGGACMGSGAAYADFRALGDLVPTTSVIVGDGASAALGWALQAHEVVAQKDTFPGHAGAWTMHVDMSKHLEGQGIDVEYTYSGQYKVFFASEIPRQEETREMYRMLTDEAYVALVQNIALGRRGKMSVDDIIATQARLYPAQSLAGYTSAVDVGFVDRVGSWEEEMGLIGAG